MKYFIISNSNLTIFIKSKLIYYCKIIIIRFFAPFIGIQISRKLTRLFLIKFKIGVWLFQNIQTFIKDQLFKVLFCKINTKFSLCFQRMKEKDCFLSLPLYLSLFLSLISFLFLSLSLANKCSFDQNFVCTFVKIHFLPIFPPNIARFYV